MIYFRFILILDTRDCLICLTVDSITNNDRIREYNFKKRIIIVNSIII
jgi:hypothetical protein